MELPDLLEVKEEAGQLETRAVPDHKVRQDRSVITVFKVRLVQRDTPECPEALETADSRARGESKDLRVQSGPAEVPVSRVKLG